jgi:hypothetical protein
VLVADEHNNSVKERLCRATVTPVASVAIPVKNPQFHLPAIPEGCVRHIVANAAGAFSGYHPRFATPEEQASVARARDILKRGKVELQCK